MSDAVGMYLNEIGMVPLLTAEEERELAQVIEAGAEARERMERGERTREVRRAIAAAEAAKDRFIRANLRLVVSVARRYPLPPGMELLDLVQEGNLGLIRAVEKFDYSRGNKFSTYASWAIMKNFARTIPNEFKHRDRFRTTAEELFLARQDERTDPYAEENAHQRRQRELGRILNRLDEREQKIIVARFGLGRGNEPATLKEVGEELGVTKERIRQLEARALTKLREAADESKIDIELGS